MSSDCDIVLGDQSTQNPRLHHSCKDQNMLCHCLKCRVDWVPSVGFAVGEEYFKDQQNSRAPYQHIPLEHCEESFLEVSEVEGVASKKHQSDGVDEEELKSKEEESESDVHFLTETLVDKCDQKEKRRTEDANDGGEARTEAFNILKNGVEGEIDREINKAEEGHQEHEHFSVQWELSHVADGREAVGAVHRENTRADCRNKQTDGGQET